MTTPTSGDDVLNGTEGPDSINGQGGNDTIHGGAGGDFIEGGPGDDEIHGDGDNDVFPFGDLGDDTIFGGDGDDTFSDVTHGFNVWHGEAGADVFNIQGLYTNATITGGEGVDQYSMRLDSDYGNTAAVVTDFAEGTGGDQISVEGLLTNSAALGAYSGGNPFHASLGFLKLEQVGLDAVLKWDPDGLAGNAHGLYTVLTLQNVMTDDITSANFVGGISHLGGDVPGLTVNVSGTYTGSFFNDSITGSDGGDVINGSGGSDTIHGGGSGDVISGGAGNDLIHGDAGNDVFPFGDLGNDTIFGGDGDDTFSDVTHGLNVWHGEAGADVFNIQAKNTSATITGGEGIDLYAMRLDSDHGNTAAVVTDFAAGAGGDHIDVEGLLTNSAALGAYSGGNPFHASLGFLKLEQVGLDAVLKWDPDGLAGNAHGLYTVLTLQNVMAGDITSANFVGAISPLGDDVPGDTITGSGTINGGPFNDLITGGDGADNINGSGGSDTIHGGGGGDLINGGAGNDLIHGDAGNDVFPFGDLGNDTVFGGDGDDTFSDVTHGINVWHGEAGADIFNIQGLFTSATITGGAGVDRYSMRLDSGFGNNAAAVTDFAAGSGGDQISVEGLLTSSAALGAYNGGNPFQASIGVLALEQSGLDTLLKWDPDGVAGSTHGFYTVLTLLGVARASVTSDNFSGQIVIGDDADNILQGGIGNDRIEGRGGDDVLDGNLGRDEMLGGTGNDTYFVEDAGDQTIENAGEGVDTVNAEISLTLSANLENLTLLGTADLSGTGNAAANVIAGNAGANLLDGGAGGDTLAGGAGNDTFVVDDAADHAVEGAAEGVDAVRASISYQLAANLENLELLGTADLAGSGNDADNVVAGNAGANALAGAAGADTLDGGAGADTLAGGVGDDVLVVDSAGDALVELAGEGRDLAAVSLATFDLRVAEAVEDLEFRGGGGFTGHGNAAGNVIRSAGGDDTLNGDAGDDTLAGGDGDNFLSGGSGHDAVLLAGSRSDYLVSVIGAEEAENVAPYTLTGLEPGDVVNLVAQGGRLDRLSGVERVVFFGASLEDTSDDVEVLVNREELLRDVPVDVEETYQGDVTGTDELTGTAGNDVLDGLDGDDELSAGAGNDTLFGGQGADTLIAGAGNDVLNGGSGDDALAGGAGNDVYTVDSGGDSIAEAAGQGRDRVRTALAEYSLAAWGEVEELEFTGDGAFRGIGNAKGNLILGGAGGDTLDGGAGADRMEGGAGDDTYVVDRVANAVTGAAGDAVVESAGAGTDTVMSSVTYTLGANLENLILTGTANINGTGNGLNNELTGNSGNNVLSGAAGNDTFFASGGNDRFVGGAGNDTLDLSAFFAFADKGTGFTVTRPNTTTIRITDVDTQQKLFTVTGAWGASTGDRGIESFVFSDQTVTLEQLYADVASSLADVFIGTAGADSMAGGVGNDTYTVDHAGDVVTELPGQGTDLVRSVLDSYTLTANVEQLLYTGSGNFAGTGNTAANKLTGGAGADTLNGGLGADRMEGGAGNDTYVVDRVASPDGLTPGDVVVELLDAGTETVQSSVTYTLGAHLENLTLTGTANRNGTGNALANELIGNAGNNVLNGAAGNDTFLTSGGNDRFVGGAGNDTLNLASLFAFTQKGVAGGFSVLRTDATSVVITDLDTNQKFTAQTLESFVFSDQAVTLAQLIANTGGAGADTLTAGAGDDVLVGGAGNDTYVVDSAADQVLELAGQGTDLVRTALDAYTLGANVERLLYTGSGNFAGTGNTAANKLTGGAGADTLNGGLGADRMEGGAGDDTYVVDRVTSADGLTPGDVVVELLNAGTDTVQSSVSYTLGANLENLVLIGSLNRNGTGNGRDNALTGNDGRNVLSGGAGNDTLNGGAGMDTLRGGAGADAFIFDSVLGAANVDTIVDFAPGEDRIRLDDAVFTQSVFGEHLLYDPASGELRHDADGAGAGEAVLFAILGTVTRPALTAGDFELV